MQTITTFKLSLSLVFALALGFAGCAGDDEEEASADSDDDTAEDARGDGDPEASTATFRGDELDLHQVECQEQFDHERVEIMGIAEDPRATEDGRWEELRIAVDALEEGGRLHIRHVGPLDGESFDGDRWELPTSERDQVEVDWDGASGAVELELDAGADGDPDSEDAILEFDLVC